MIAGVPVLLRPDWEKLVPPDDPDHATPAATDLPDAARRWLRSSIDPNTPHWTTLQLVMRGELKYLDWREFIARQIVNVDHGFIWAALASRGVPMQAVDQYTDGEGRFRFRVAGVVPIRWQDPDQLARSAAARFALESLYVPTGFDRWTFAAGAHDHEFVVTVPVGEHNFDITVTTDADDHLASARMLRFGWPDERGPGVEAPFGVRVNTWSRWNGVLIPHDFSAFWWYDSAGEKEFYRAKVSLATFA